MKQAKEANDGLFGEFIDRQSIGPLSYSDMCLSIYLTDQFALISRVLLKTSWNTVMDNLAMVDGCHGEEWRNNTSSKPISAVDPSCFESRSLQISMCLLLFGDRLGPSTLIYADT